MMVRALVLAMLILLPAELSAQAITVIGGSEDAEECFLTAQVAAASQLGGYSDAPCDFALDHVSLSSRNRTATFINRGIIRVANGDYQKGFRDYQRALALSPDTPETYVNLGNVYFLGEKFAAAVEMYGKALELELARDHIAYLNRGMAYEHLGNAKEAEADYRRAIELMPEWQAPRDKLLRLMSRKERILSAQRDARGTR